METAKSIVIDTVVAPASNIEVTITPAAEIIGEIVYTGKKGDPGPKGDKGDPGPKGDKGDPGENPNDGILTIQKNGTVIGTFTANSLEDVTVNIEADQQVNADWDADSGPAQILNKPTDLEYTSNKVTVLDKNVTDDQYPSAKAVWDATLRVVRNASGTMVFLKG